jgi:hypothetical protein
MLGDSEPPLQFICVADFDMDCSNPQTNFVDGLVDRRSSEAGNEDIGLGV